jgi:MFS family permease
VADLPTQPEARGVRRLGGESGALLADRRVRVVLATIFVTMAGFGIIAPILPLYAQSFGVGYGAVGLLVASFAFTRLAFDLVAGPLVDRYGERATLSVGVIFLGITTVLLGHAPTFAWAVVFRASGGAGSALLFAALYSYYLKIVPPERVGRAFGLFYGTFNVGMIAGQPLGGFIAGITGSLRMPLYTYSVFCFAAGVLFLLLTERSPRVDRPSERPTLHALRDLARLRPFVTANVANFAAFWVIGGVWSTLIPLFGHNALGMSELAIGTVLSLSIAAEFVVLYPFGAIVDRHGWRLLLVLASIAYAAVVAVLGLPSSVLVFALLLVLMGLASGAGATAPPAMLHDVATEESTGTAVGAFRFCGDLGFAVGPAVAGWSANRFGFAGAYLLAALPLVATALLAVRTPETQRAPVTPGRPAA